MLKPIRTNDGKLLFKWDKERMAIEIANKKKISTIYLRDDGTYQIKDKLIKTTAI